LTRESIEKIVEIQLMQVEDRLKERGITLAIEKSARKYLAEEGFDPEFGARPMKRLIQKMILDRLADKIIRGELKDGGKVKVNYKADSLVFTS
jgi:ATP-dependent Clp protease ATP-binding subunit ClpB